MSVCDEEPCKSKLVAYENAKQAQAKAVKNVETAKAARLVSCGGAGGTLLVGGGVVAAAGGPIGWIIGGLMLGAGAALSLDCIGKTRDVRRVRATCAATDTAYIAAIRAVMSSCPKECWPGFPTMPCP